MKKLENVFKANDPFVNEENELFNIITKAVTPETVKEAVLKCHEIGQDLFNNFVKEKIVEHILRTWSLMKKTNLQTLKNTRERKEE